MFKHNDISKGILKSILVLAVISVILLVFYNILDIVVYLIISVIFSLICQPIVSFLNTKLRIPRFIGTLSIFGIFIYLITLMVSLVIPLFTEQSKPLYLVINIDFFEYINVEIESIFPESFQLKIKQTIKSLIEDIIGVVNNHLPSFFQSVFNSIGSVSIGVFSVFFISYFLTEDKNMIMNIFYTIIPPKNQNKFFEIISKIKYLLSRYFIGLIIQMLIIFIIYSISLKIVGVNNAFVIASICALLNIIPYIGPLISIVLMLLFTLSQSITAGFLGNDIISKVIGISIGFLVAQLIDNFLSQPLIYSGSIKSHPLEVFIVIILAGSLFGVVGMVLAIPGYTVLKVILKELYPNNRILNALSRKI